MQENTKEKLIINERIAYILEYYHVSRYKFAKETGISESVLLNIFKGKNKPSIDFIEKLLNRYQSINANWLITGNGSMFNESTDKKTDELKCLADSFYKKMLEDKDEQIAKLNREIGKLLMKIELLNK